MHDGGWQTVTVGSCTALMMIFELLRYCLRMTAASRPNFEVYKKKLLGKE